MQLTRHTDYALRTLMFLASSPGLPVSVSTISLAFGISPNTVAKVAKDLVKRRLVHARRGRAGGLSLAVEPGTVRVGALVRAVEPGILLECFDARRNTCPIDAVCQLRHALALAREAFFATLDRYTLADIVANRKALVRALPELLGRSR